ncbi:hypothetical protein BGW39_009267 [Mortierella sp. 14UC]|nr:hypothetical protein BGW39_009267 [Mortierella sp. 14UC]
MLNISPIARPDRFLNETMPFVNASTAGTMNFTLTSPELLDLDSYQRTLKRLIAGLASLNGSHNNSNSSRSSSSRSAFTTATATAALVSSLEVDLGAGAAFILDTALADNTNSNNNDSTTEGSRKPMPVHRSYPFSFVASGQLPVLQSPSTLDATTATTKKASTSPPPATTTITTTTVQPLSVLYYIRLPWNPQTHGIQCQLSARRLPSHHVAILDRILRRLCDASPGAFMIGYSDGLSGVDAGTEVIYSGENSRYAQHQHQHQYQHRKALRAVGTGTLDQSIAIARDRGDMDLDHHVAGLVGQVDHHHHQYQHHPADDTPTTDTALPSMLLKKSILKDLPIDANTQQIQHQLQLPQQQRNATATLTATATNAKVDVYELGQLLLTQNESNDVVNYDFGLWEDVDQWVNVHSSVDIDHLHDAIWVNSY